MSSKSKSWLAAEATGIFAETECGFLASVEEGRADAKQGRTVAHEDVKRWLESWGSAKESGPPRAK